jgi:hypothetical protein
MKASSIIISSGFNTCVTPPIYSEDSGDIYLPSGSCIYALNHETGFITTAANDSNAKSFQETDNYSSISSMRMIKKFNGQSSSYVDELLTSGSDNQIILWTKKNGDNNNVWTPYDKLSLFGGDENNENKSQILFDVIIPTFNSSKLYLLVSSNWKCKNNSNLSSSQKSHDSFGYRVLCYSRDNSKISKICEISNKFNNLFLFYSDYKVKKEYSIYNEFIITTSKRKLISISVISNIGPRLLYPDSFGTITSLAVNTLSDVAVTGHESGQMVICHNLSDWILKRAETPVFTHIHWHSHQVTCLSTSLDGNLLYSGGNIKNK